MQLKPGRKHGEPSPQYKWCLVCGRWVDAEDFTGQTDHRKANMDPWSKHEAVHAPIAPPQTSRR